jgi:hypothetical protein
MGNDMTVTNIDDFKALAPFFRIEKGLDGLADGGHFFDLFADDAITPSSWSFAVPDQSITVLTCTNTSDHALGPPSVAELGALWRGRWGLPATRSGYIVVVVVVVPLLSHRTPRRGAGLVR